MEEHAAVRGEVELAKARIESELNSSLQLAQASPCQALQLWLLRVAKRCIAGAV
jgi:hypothetical protein